MINWLSDRGIPFSDWMWKLILYSLIKFHKPQFKTFKIDALLAEHGHSALRLLPYHPDLNPIELIWVSVKEYVARKNVSFCLDQCCANFLHSWHTKYCRRVMAAHQPHFAYCWGGEMDVLLSNSI
jgi:hypothetical protein